jgi:hypothetical protein
MELCEKASFPAFFSTASLGNQPTNRQDERGKHLVMATD